MSLIFDLCDAIVDAVNAASAAGTYQFPLSAEVLAKGDFPAEQVNEVAVFVFPDGQQTAIDTLQGGTTELLDVIVAIQRQLKTAELDEVRGMMDVVDAVLATMRSDVAAGSFDWLSSDAAPIYRHDLLGQNIFQTNIATQWRVQG